MDPFDVFDDTFSPGTVPQAAAASAQVVPFPAPPAPAQSVPPADKRHSRSVEVRWTARLAKSFCPVSSYFLANYHRLRPHEQAKGLTSTEAMVLIQIMDHRWDERAPFPAMKTLAQRMGLAARTIRAAIKNLEDLGYIRRERSIWGGPNRYHFKGLFEALEKLMDEDAAKRDAADAAKEPARG